MDDLNPVNAESLYFMVYNDAIESICTEFVVAKFIKTLVLEAFILV